MYESLVFPDKQESNQLRLLSCFSDFVMFDIEKLKILKKSYQSGSCEVIIPISIIKAGKNVISGAALSDIHTVFAAR